MALVDLNLYLRCRSSYKYTTSNRDGRKKGEREREREREREMFYLTTHSTHFIYGYMASDIW